MPTHTYYYILAGDNLPARDWTPIRARRLALHPQGGSASIDPATAVVLARGDRLYLIGGRGRVIASAAATATLYDIARACARSVADLWRPEYVVQRYLETGDITLRSMASCTAQDAVHHLSVDAGEHDRADLLAARAAAIAACCEASLAARQAMHLTAAARAHHLAAQSSEEWDTIYARQWRECARVARRMISAYARTLLEQRAKSKTKTKGAK